MKTLGQVAYEALVVGYGENVDAKEWPGLSQTTHDAWQAAAEAVVMATTVELILLPQKRAVIEAAEALFNGYTAEDSHQDYWKNDAVLDHRLYALFLKVEALQEVE